MHMGELAGDQALGQNRAAVSLSSGQQFDQLANESAQWRLRVPLMFRRLLSNGF
jgi:hypothetical protein